MARPAAFRLRVVGEKVGTTTRKQKLASNYARRRNSAARTRARNCSGVSVGGTGAAFGFTAACDAGFATFFAALRAASFASCLAAKSFASASTVSAGAPSSGMRWSWECPVFPVARQSPQVP